MLFRSGKQNAPRYSQYRGAFCCSLVKTYEAISSFIAFIICTLSKKVKRLAILSIQIVLLTELPAHPVHPGPDGEGEDEIHRIFQRADQRLAEESHHGHHNGLARQKGEQIAFLVKVRDAEGQMQERQIGRASCRERV